MSAQMTATTAVMTKDMIFKNENRGTSKKSGKQFRIITLHEAQTLDNIDFFIGDAYPVDTTGINFKDKVRATFTMDFVYGRPQMVLVSIQKI